MGVLIMNKCLESKGYGRNVITLQKNCINELKINKEEKQKFNYVVEHLYSIINYLESLYASVSIDRYPVFSKQVYEVIDSCYGVIRCILYGQVESTSNLNEFLELLDKSISYLCAGHFSYDALCAFHEVSSMRDYIAQ